MTEERLTAGDLAALLRARIRDERPAPGQLLESDEEIGQRYGVTKNVARRAWMHLVREGLVRRSQGAGTFMGQGVPEPSLTERIADLEQRLADAPTREEFNDLKQQVDQLVRDQGADVSGTSSATPRRKRA